MVIIVLINAQPIRLSFITIITAKVTTLSTQRYITHTRKADMCRHTHACINYYHAIKHTTTEGTIKIYKQDAAER